METQAILLLVISGFMLAAGNGLEESLDEFGKKLQNEIDMLKESITIQDQQIKNLSLQNNKLRENITEIDKDAQRSTYNIAQICRLVVCCNYRAMYIIACMICALAV